MPDAEFARSACVWRWVQIEDSCPAGGTGAFGLILLGLLIGLPLTFAAGRFLGTQLYGISPYNPVVILVAVVALGFSALVASFVPAFRAS